MKRVCTVMLGACLLFASLFPCSAYNVPAMQGYSAYADYRQCISQQPIKDVWPSETFVTYCQISGLGRYENFFYPQKYMHYYCYRLRDEFGDFLLKVMPNTSLSNALNHPLDDLGRTFKEIGVASIIDPTHMVVADVEENEESHSLFLTGRLTYCFYNHTSAAYAGKLCCIAWEHNGDSYVLSGIKDYPRETNSLVGELLNLDTAEESLEKLLSDIDGDYEMPIEEIEYLKEQKMKSPKKKSIIGMCIITGIAVFVVIALPIVIVKRKRKKKAARASEE